MRPPLPCRLRESQPLSHESTAAPCQSTAHDQLSALLPAGPSEPPLPDSQVAAGVAAC